MAKVKKTTDQKIDELAMAVKGGFDTMEKNSDERYKSTIERFQIIESEIKDIKGLLPNSILIKNKRIEVSGD